MRTDTGLASLDPATEPRGREQRVLFAVGVAVAAVAVGLYVLSVATDPAIATLKGFDLHIYLSGGELAKNKPAYLYTWKWEPGIQFTYTPFAALLFGLFTWVRFRVLLDVLALVSLASLAVTVWIAFRELGWRGMARTGGTLLVTGIALWLQPVQRTLFLGQIELVLMALIVWDLCQPDRRWWKGAATGVAAGIKLVPLIFIAYLLVTRRFRQAAVAAAAFVVTVLVGFPLLPHASRQWWLHGYFLQASRTGFIGEMLNQSERGLITRLIGSVASAQPVWLATAIVTGILGLAAAMVLDRAGNTFAGLMVCALTALLVSPISWDHHWVWIVPGAVVAAHYAVQAWRRGARRTAAACGTGAVGLVAWFGAWPTKFFHVTPSNLGTDSLGLLWIPKNTNPSWYQWYGDQRWFPEYRWHGWALIWGNSFILAGLAMFGLLLAISLVLPAARKDHDDEPGRDPAGERGHLRLPAA
jgi:alpha-1,2-mannosyltransferase